MGGGGWQRKVAKDAFLDKEGVGDPLDLLRGESFPGFGLTSLSLSLALHLPLHKQQKWDYPEKKRERERKKVKKKKGGGVFMAELRV